MKNTFKMDVDTKKLERLIASEPKKVERWLASVAADMVSDIKLSFGTSPDGESYKRGTVTHVASQPGNPPNVDTGTLRASIRHDSEGSLTQIIHDGTEYGIWLEEGTERMGSRPFIAPVFADWEKKIGAHAKQHLDLENE